MEYYNDSAGEALSVISGDPHILSFDKRNLHPQGICKYNIATSDDPEATFEVFSKFERRGTNEDVSYVKYIEVAVYNHTVRLDRHKIVYVRLFSSKCCLFSNSILCRLMAKLLTL